MKSKAANLAPQRKSTRQGGVDKHKQSNGLLKRKWSRDELNAAMESVLLRDESISNAAATYGLPINTLEFYVNKQKKKQEDELNLSKSANHITEISIDDKHEPDNELDDEDQVVEDSGDEEVREIFIDMPRASMARKSTSPMKFYVNNYFKNLPSYKSSETKNSTDTATKTITIIEPKQPKQRPASKSNQTSITQTNSNVFTGQSLSNSFAATTVIPSTQSVIDFILNKEKNMPSMLQNKAPLLAEFEKPIKIYSYLSLRHRYHPIFLNRTLNYAQTSSRRSTKRNNSPHCLLRDVTDRLLKLANSKLKDESVKISPRKNLNQKQQLNLKFTFDSFHLGESQLIELIQEDFNSREVKFKLANFIEVSGIKNNNSSPDYLGVCQCPISFINLTNKTNELQCWISETSPGAATLSLKIDRTEYTHLVLKSTIKKDLNVGESKMKKRRSNRVTHLDDEINRDKVNNRGILREDYVICAFQSGKENTKTKLNAGHNVIQLNWETNSAYTLQMKQITSKNKSLFDSLKCKNDTEFKQSQTDVTSKQVALDSNKNNKRSKSKTETNESVEQLLNQFYQKNTLGLVKFSIELDNSRSHQTPIKLEDTEPKCIFNVSPSIAPSENQSGSELKRQTRSGQLKQQEYKPLELSRRHLNGGLSQQVLYQFNSVNHVNVQKNAKNNQNNKLLTQNSSLACPFCNSCFGESSCLLTHIRMCHFRFHVSEQHGNALAESSSLADMSIEAKQGSHAFEHSASLNCLNSKVKKVQFNIWYDDIYDGSYLGNPYDMQHSFHLGYAMCRVKPAKRSSVTYVLVNKKSNFIDLGQFNDLTPAEITAINLIQQHQQQLNYPMQANGLYNAQAGMERLYYHTTTTLPIGVNELDVDSDNDLDPDWLKEYTTLLINEFADVNEGEKAIMRLWNLHLLHHNFVADSQVYRACELFISEQTPNLVKLNLFNNFLLHLANLHDYGLLKPQEILNLVDLLHETKQFCLKS